MKRRGFIATTVGIATAGCLSRSNNNKNIPQGQTSNNKEEIPESVVSLKPLAEGFARRLYEHYPHSSVSIGTENNIIVNLKIEENVDLRTEINKVAKLFADTVKEGNHEPASLDIVSGEVHAMVVEPNVRYYVNGDINQEAYLKTIEIL